MFFISSKGFKGRHIKNNKLKNWIVNDVYSLIENLFLNIQSI